MNTVQKKERRDKQNIEIRKLFDQAVDVCLTFFDEEYSYSSKEAMDELGIDDELIEQLVEDYVSQIIRDVIQFEEMLYKLQSKVDAKEDLDYIALRELAHKNLGVARNLRIKDAVVLLGELMKKDDLEYLFSCIETLRACAIKLKPLYAYKTIKIIEVKNTF
jgi:hypothetical protein